MEVLVGLIMPFLVVLSSAIFSVFLEYITEGNLDARNLIPRFFPVVKLEGSSNDRYWIILDQFYFKLKYETKRCGYCSRTPATWILTIIVSLSLFTAVSYFMTTNIIQQVTLHSCPDSSMELDCFNGDFEYIDCNATEINNTTFDRIYCFKFLRFGRDTDIIGEIANSFAFYLAILAFFTVAVHIASVLNTLQPTKLWGIGFVVIFFLIVFIGSILLAFLTVEITQIVQVFMIAFIILLIGLLLFSQWDQLVDIPPGPDNHSTTNGQNEPTMTTEQPQPDDHNEQTPLTMSTEEPEST